MSRPRPDQAEKKEGPPNGGSTVGQMLLLQAAEEIAYDEDMRRCKVGLCDLSDVSRLPLVLDAATRRQVHESCHMDPVYREVLEKRSAVLLGFVMRGGIL